MNNKNKKDSRFKPKFFVMLFVAICTIVFIVWTISNTTTTKKQTLTAEKFEIQEKEKEMSSKILELEEKEKAFKEKEKALENKEEKYKENIAKFEADKKEQKRKSTLELMKEQDSDKVVENYQKMIGELLNDSDSSLYSAVSKVSTSLNSLGDDVDNMKSKSWKKKMIANTKELSNQLLTITKFPIEDVPMAHKASYIELINAVKLYDKATSSISKGINKNDINSVVKGSSYMSDGAKYFQIALNIYSTESGKN